MGLVYDEDNSLKERIKRGLMNPSKRTLLIAAAVILVIASPFLVNTFNNAQEGIGEVTAEHDLTTLMGSSPTDLTDEEIGPWIASQGEIMINATRPPQWEVGNYRFGPCSADRVSEITNVGYGASIAEACDRLYDIQGKYSRDCFIASNCVVKDEAKDQITAVIDLLKSAQSDAGYSWPVQ